MKFAILSLLAGLVSALPTTDRPVAAPLQERQALFLGATRNDLENGGACPQTIFIYARASGEGGNLGILGGPVGDGIQRAFGAGSVWVQGVGGAYSASLAGNLARDGTTRAAIAEMNRLFELADATCPDAQIVAGGYSQGTALAAATVAELDPRIRDKVAGVVLFGYTKVRYACAWRHFPFGVLTEGTEPPEQRWNSQLSE